MRPKGGSNKTETKFRQRSTFDKCIEALSKRRRLWQRPARLRIACAFVSPVDFLRLPRSPSSRSLNDVSLVLDVPTDSASPRDRLMPRCEGSRFSAKLPAHFWSSVYVAQDALTTTKPSFPFGTDSVFPGPHPISN